MNKQTVELKDLVGPHKLSGVDMAHESMVSEYNNTYDGNVIRFVLDGKTYTACEDDNDGYRSAMRDIFVTEEKVSNTFNPVQVLVVYREHDCNYRKDDIIDFYDTKNGKRILSVGTEDTDDYYPSFVSNWTPENLSVNKTRKKKITPHK